MLRALLYAYVLGGITFIPLVVVALVFITIYTSVPVGDVDVTKRNRGHLEAASLEDAEKVPTPIDTNDAPRTRKGWLTMRRTFEETAGDGSYVTLVRSFLDSHSKDPKRSRPKDMWYIVLKGKVLYLYENEEMSECEAAIELSSHQVVIYPEDLPDGELFAKRNAICLKPKTVLDGMPSVTKQMQLGKDDGIDEKLDASSVTGSKGETQRDPLLDSKKVKNAAREEALDPSTPWFLFVRSNIEMEDWYLSLIHASEHPAQTPTLTPLSSIFDATDMDHLVATLDEQPDVIPMRWLNALLGRVFFSHYRTHNLEAYIIGRLMKKLSKVKRPAFLTEVAVTQVSVGNKAPMLSKPMLKDLTKEGDASIEVHLQYKGEVRITVEATAVINLGARFKSYTVKLTLAVVLRELEGNLLVKVKRPPSNRIWYAFTQTPRMVMEVEPIVSDRQITWGMILSTIESKIKEIVQESVVMPNMDDIAFFETGSYEHRGGIWSDACRIPHVSTIVPSPVPNGAQSVASVPLPETSPHSFGDLMPEHLSTNNAISGDDTSVSVVEDIADSSHNSTRRRTWFAAVRNEDFASPDFSPDGQPSDSMDSRGRTAEPEMSATPRSLSAPKTESFHVAEPEKEASEGSQCSTPLRSSTSRRSSSHSLKLERPSQKDGATAPLTKSTPTTPRKNSDPSQIARSPSPPSFFSTLRSKAAAADKQAISNSAKEAIRKLGVNWGGFKKDANNSSQPSEESSESGGSPSRSSGLFAEGSALAHRARMSYAEVRAAVTERKERERTTTTSQVEDNSDSSLSQSYATTAKARVTSNPRTTLPNQSVYSETPINPSIVTSAARLATTPRLVSKKSTPSISRVNTEADTQDLPTAEEPKHAPIYVQPQAKTMSIPGIHASHRGEVQSMGYVAPQPPTPTGPSETMLKNPAIQTVYRLWKNPSAPGQEPASRAPSDSVQPQAVSEQTSYESVEDIIPTDDVGSPLPPNQLLPASPVPKPTPPPLPPRSTLTLIPAPTASPSTSQTLKTIAQMDETSRSQAVVESLSTGSADHPLPLQDSVDTVTVSTEEPEDIRGPNIDLHPSRNINHSQPQSASGKAPPTLPPRRITTPA